MQPTPARSPTLNFVTCAADLDDAADDLVAGNHREDRAAPLVARLVDVGVADAAEENLDRDVGGRGSRRSKSNGSIGVVALARRRRRLCWPGALVCLAAYSVGRGITR